MKPKKGFVARVEQHTDSSYLVCLTRCHLCDGKLGRFTCGRGPDEREVVAKITHSFRRINSNNPMGMDFRSMTVTMPVVSDSGMRKIWCPRSFEISFPRDIGRSIDMNEVISRYPSMGVRYLNKLPEWNEDYKSLVLKFQGNRVLTASSKNFLIYAEKYFKPETANPSVRSARGDTFTSSNSERKARQEQNCYTYGGKGGGKCSSSQYNSSRFFPGYDTTENEVEFEATNLNNYDISQFDFESSGFDENSSLSTPVAKTTGKSRKKSGSDASESMQNSSIYMYYPILCEVEVVVRQ